MSPEQQKSQDNSEVQSNTSFEVGFSSGTSHASKIGILIPLGILLFCTLYTLTRSVSWPLIHDAPLMHYIASQIISGLIPYKDIFDMNMPGTYLAHMFVLTFLGPGDFSWRMFDLFWLLFATFSIWIFTRPFGVWPSAFASLFYIALHLSKGPIRMGQRDFLMLPFLLLASHLVARCLERANPHRNLFLAGLLVGCGMTIKPFSLILLVFLATFYLLKTHRNPRRALLGLVTLIGSSLIAPVLMLAWLNSMGSLYSLWDLLTHYLLPLYNTLHNPSYTSLLKGFLLGTFLVLPALLILPLLIWKCYPSIDSRLTILMLGTLYGAIHFFIQGKGWSYHLEPFNYFFFTLFISFLGLVMRQGRTLAKGAVVTGLFLMSLVMGAQSLAAGITIHPYVSNKQALVQELVKNLSEYHLTDTDTVQVLDTTGGGIHALYRLGLQQPTKFIYDFHFFHNMGSPFIKNLRSEFIHALQTRPPAVIVVFHEDWLPPHDLTRFETFPEFTALLTKDYPVIRVHNGYTIYASQ